MAEGDFAESDVRRLAGARSYERGLGYLDAVSGLRAEAGRISASVDGGRRYRVVLDGGRASRGTCDCPYGEEGNFCKHLVAVALTVLRDPARVSASRRETAARDAALGGWLDGLGREELLALVRERMAEDEDLRGTLTLRAATVAGDTAAVLAGIGSLVDATEFTRYGCVGYVEARGYAARVARAAEAIRELAAAGRATAAVAAAREAIAVLGSVYESVDDSGGHLSDAVDRLTRAHHAACAAGPVDPEGTARWLVGHLLGHAGELLDVRPADYRDVLGADGLATMRALGDEALRRNPRGRAEKALVKSLARADRERMR